MTLNPPDPKESRESAELPLFYREFLAEREEILRNKWLLSEGAGHDVGFDRALVDWVTSHRAAWLAQRSGRLGKY
jgi:uncharacterized Fe-S cluster-containing radical SAM superfamily protein